MVAVSETDNSSVNLHALDFSSEEWNTSADFSGYPVSIVSSSGIGGLDSASISLDPDYDGGDADDRIVFVGLTVSGNSDAIATSGIYRLEDNKTYTLKTGAKIHSIGF